MNFLGIDIGYDRCGICILDYDVKKDSTSIVFAGSILTSKELQISERLKILSDDLTFIKNKYSPGFVSIEKLFFNRKNSVFEKICMAKGVAMVVFENTNIVEVEPKRMKSSICGDGSANKTEIKRILQYVTKIPLDKVYDDTVDAICLGLYHIQLFKMENLKEKSVFNSNLERLKK